MGKGLWDFVVFPVAAGLTSIVIGGCVALTEETNVEKIRDLGYGLFGALAIGVGFVSYRGNKKTKENRDREY